MKIYTLPMLMSLLAIGGVEAGEAAPKVEAAPKAEPAPKADVPKDGEEGEAGESEDEVHKLLAKRDREKGAQRFGKDPAFLVFPRPLERNERARELITPQVAAMIEKGLAYLQRTQDADGGWSDKQYLSNTGVASLA